MKNKILSLAAISLVGASLNASAIDTSATLSWLWDSPANSIGIGDKVFDHFDFVVDGLTSFNPDNIIVSASIDGGVYYLKWTGNFSLGSTTLATADIKLGYKVTASAGSIDWIDQSITGGASGGLGSASLIEQVRTGSPTGPIVGHSHVDFIDFQDPEAEMTGPNIDLLGINPPQATLWVTKDLGLVIAPNQGQVGITTVSIISQSFHQRGVADGGMTLTLLGAGLSALGLVRRKLNA